LLFIRSAIIALLAFALARPVAQGKWSSADPQGHVTAALLLDCSASMAFDENGRTRFQMAQAAARQIIRGLRPGDRVALILMGLPSSPADLEPTGDLRAIEARIDEAKISYGRADLAESLGLAADTLARFEKSARDIYIVCDRQALSWDSVNSEFATKWRAQMAGPGITNRTFVLPVGSVDSDNIAVDSARLVNPPAVVGQPADIEVVVHNYGPVQHAAVPVSIEGSNLAVAQKSISLAPGQSLPVLFPVTFGQSGSQVLIAKIKSAGYTSDDQLDMAVDVISPIRVLVVSGDEQPGQFRGAGDFLKWALAPHRAAAMSGGDPCDVTVVAAEKWSDADLPKYQVVVLANVERFSKDQASALEKDV
jgi:hypothetical protein